MRSKSFGSVRIIYPPYDREELLSRLQRGMSVLREKLPLKRVLLIGSYASGRHTPASDIDLMVVYEGDPREDAYALVKRTLDIRGLQPHVYSEADYEKLRSTLDRMCEPGIMVYERTLGK